jgi:hypothetical protein
MKILILIFGFGFVRWSFQSGAENLSVSSGFLVLAGAAVASILAILIFKWGFELLDSPAAWLLILVFLPAAASAQNQKWVGSYQFQETGSGAHRNFYDVAPYAEYKVTVGKKSARFRSSGRVLENYDCITKAGKSRIDFFYKTVAVRNFGNFKKGALLFSLIRRNGKVYFAPVKLRTISGKTRIVKRSQLTL